MNKRETMPTEALSARSLTLRLVARAETERNAGGSGDGVSVDAVNAAAERACRELSRSLGVSGFNALLTRALAQAQKEHPLLKEISLRRLPEPMLGDLSTIIQTHGAPAVAAGLEAALESMVELLRRLIGIDVVARLLASPIAVETLEDEGGQ